MNTINVETAGCGTHFPFWRKAARMLRAKILRWSKLDSFVDCRDGRVDNAQALRACGPAGPHGFESHSRRLFTSKIYIASPIVYAR